MSNLAGAPGFYNNMAVVFAAVAILGFAPSYWVPLFRGTLDMAPVVHLHALFFYGWIALFVFQTRLAATGRIIRHREFGVAGVALATGMCFVGLAAAIHGFKRLDAAGHGDAARAFTIIPVTSVLLFAGLLTAALLHVKYPATHKRLLLVATITILQAAVGRVLTLLLAPPVPPGAIAPPPPVVASIGGSLLTDLLLVAAMLHDHRVNGRIHPAYWYAGAAVLAIQLLRVPVSRLPAWHAAVDALAALAP
jgi:hypothetical protein